MQTTKALVRGQSPHWSQNTSSFWTFNGRCKFAHFLIFGDTKKSHTSAVCMIQDHFPWLFNNNTFRWLFPWPHKFRLFPVFPDLLEPRKNGIISPVCVLLSLLTFCTAELHRIQIQVSTCSIDVLWIENVQCHCITFQNYFLTFIFRWSILFSDTRIMHNIKNVHFSRITISQKVNIISNNWVITWT